MSYRELLPHPALGPFVDRLWVSHGEGGRARRILPDGCIDLLCSLSGTPHTRLVGTMTHAQLVDPPGPFRYVAVRFRPGGAAPLLKLPADACTDRVLDGRELGLRGVHAELLAEAPDLRSAARSLERMLLARLSAARPPEPLVARSVARLFEARPPSVAELARDAGTSRQHLTRLFRREVGIGPKQLARVARLQRALVFLQHARAPELAESALASGYFDQAHMNREFRSLSGVTPRVAAAAADSIFPIRSLFDPACIEP